MNLKPQKQKGIALIAAIFLVVVIGAALVILATLSLRNSQQTTQNLLQMRAQMAASASIEYGVQYLINGGNCGDLDSIGVVSVAAYSDYTITLSCISSDYNRPSQSISLATLTATVEYGSAANADYVWTELEATIEL